MNNTFEIVIEKVNDASPIILKNIDRIPGYFQSTFDDVDRYKSLIEE